jgi:hypothetical protein
MPHEDVSLSAYFHTARPASSGERASAGCERERRIDRGKRNDCPPFFRGDRLILPRLEADCGSFDRKV